MHDREIVPGPVLIGVGGPDVRDVPVSMPWYRSWDGAEEHQRLAGIHRSAAAALEAQYDAACKGLGEPDAALSPLVRYAVGAWRVSSGAIVYLSPDAGPPDQLLARIRCHRAYMMLAPANMDDCPLDLPDLELDARGDAGGITLSLTVRNAALVPELQRRVEHELEAWITR
jgi:hypothetical protein